MRIECLLRKRTEGESERARDRKRRGTQSERDDCVSGSYLTKASVNLPGKVDRPLLFGVIWISNNKHLNEIPNGPVAISGGR